MTVIPASTTPFSTNHSQRALFLAQQMLWPFASDNCGEHKATPRKVSGSRDPSSSVLDSQPWRCLCCCSQHELTKAGLIQEPGWDPAAHAVYKGHLLKWGIAPERPARPPQPVQTRGYYMLSESITVPISTVRTSQV